MQQAITPHQQAFPAYHPDVFAHPARAAIPDIHSQPSTIHHRSTAPAATARPPAAS